MLMIAVVCAGILDPRAGCITERTRVYNLATPQQCVMKAQETLAEQVASHINRTIAFWGCSRVRG